MLIAAAVCPHPPLLVPAIGGHAPELEALRAACAAALALVLSADPDLIVVVGDADATVGVTTLARADFADWGVDATVGDPAAISLPLSLGIGRWLLDPWLDGPAEARHQHWQGVSRELPTTEAAELGAELAASRPRVGMLVMADLSARRTEQAPGGYDPDAHDLDAGIVAALAAADTAALLALDPVRCDRALMAGRASLAVLAGAMAGSDTTGPAADGGRWTGQVLADLATWGVGYVVATVLPGD